MDHTYTIQEVAAKLNISDKTLRRWEDAGRFRSSRTLGNQRRYSVEDIQILDAIKHGTINTQKDLLSIEQAANLFGVSPTTITRWEDAGKIHPLITSGNTYYPRERLEAKIPDLKNEYIESEPKSEPEPFIPPNIPPEDVPEIIPDTLESNSRLSPMIYDTPASRRNLQPSITSALITLLMLVVYHLIFNTSSTPISPQTQGSVQGANTVAATPDPRLDDLIVKFKEHLSQQMLKDAKPVPVTTINLDNSSVISSSFVLPKDKDQVSVPSDKITTSTPVTITFNSDYAPAKKYWVTIEPGQFTVHTDFAVSSDTSFTYSFVATTISPANPVSTPSASPAISTSSAIKKN